MVPELTQWGETVQDVYVQGTIKNQVDLCRLPGVKNNVVQTGRSNGRLSTRPQRR